MSGSILIYANCQGEELQTTGRYMPALAGTIGFKWIPLHKITDADWATRYDAEFMSDVVAVWEQVETGDPTPHRRELHARLPAGLQTVRFPPLSALFMWPFAGNDPRIAADPQRYPWPDSVAAMLALQSGSDDEIFAEYMKITTERMPDLDRRLRLDVTRWQASDALSDVKVADWVERNFRETRLFHTSGHLTAAATDFVLRHLLEQTTVLRPYSVARLKGEAEALLRHHIGQDFESVPIHPLVAERLKLRFHDPNARYRWHGHMWTLRDYILHYVRWAPYLD
ncbi:MAG TPA: WcbI family polysaccharide biosynthesis putative acetyltransferase [Acetobacteraceae bacterium]|jgi:hypothetical protein